jgi:hypothetical protein|tara:strand:+ start:1340 stop:1897 length:558 start_codon:yes stop_codon:yes gene_type:complete
MKDMMDLIKIRKVEKHSEMKPTLLNLIDAEKGFKWSNGDHDTDVKYNVSKTDWEQRPSNYVDFYLTHMKEYFEEYDFVNCSQGRVHNVWFHQYHKNDFHGWHVHGGCQFASVYYLELPNKKFATQFYDYNKHEVINVDVEEGDLVIFPSFIPHQSPKVLDDGRKTVISANYSFEELKKFYYEFDL